MPDIRQELIIAAPIEKVFDAITTSNGLSSWWTPGAKADPQPGTIARFPFGSDYVKQMLITSIQPLQNVKWTCIEGASEWVGTNLSFELLSSDSDSFLNDYYEIAGQVEQMKTQSGTLLQFAHDGWKDYTQMFAECSYTWGRFLYSLKSFCETGKGNPWPMQHK